MANRVNSAEVKELVATDETIDAQITAANVLVTEKLGAQTSMTTAHLKEIERWVAAHFVACSIERQTTKEEIGQTKAEFVGSQFGAGGLGWNLTTYGQQAVLLDTTGTLAGMGKRKARLTTIDAITQ